MNYIKNSVRYLTVTSVKTTDKVRKNIKSTLRRNGLSMRFVTAYEKERKILYTTHNPKVVGASPALATN